VPRRTARPSTIHRREPVDTELIKEFVTSSANRAWCGQVAIGQPIPGGPARSAEPQSVRRRGCRGDVESADQAAVRIDDDGAVGRPNWAKPNDRPSADARRDRQCLGVEPRCQPCSAQTPTPPNGELESRRRSANRQHRLPRAAPVRKCFGVPAMEPSMSRCASYSSLRNVDLCLRSCVAPRMEVRAPRSSAASSLCEMSATCSPSSRSRAALELPPRLRSFDDRLTIPTFARRGRRKFPSLPKLPGGVAKGRPRVAVPTCRQHRFRDAATPATADRSERAA